MIKQGAVIGNALNKETFIFSGPIDDPDVAMLEVVLEEGGTGGGNAIVHIHPLADEQFTVTSGRLKVVIAGREQLLGPGETAVVPRGAAHYFANANDGRTAFKVEFRPAQQHARFFANFATATTKHPDWFSAKGAPKLLCIALALDTYPDHFYVAGLPVFIQKALFAALAPIARLFGYYAEVAPRPPGDG